MATTFGNAPLVELIAELKWDDVSHPQLSLQGGNSQSQFFAHGSLNHSSDFFMRFGGLAHVAKFSRMERLIPEGFPIFAGQPVLRFRPTENSNNSVLYQVGPGIFSANAMPPYKSWSQYRPILEEGVRLLLDARGESDKEKPFSSLSLRYLDAFTKEFTQGYDVGVFIKKILGFEVLLPNGVAKLIAEGQSPKPTFQIQIPMSGSFVMNIAIGEGMANEELAIIMDTTVISIVSIAPNLDATMSAFESAHTIIHNMFVEVTQPLSDLMQPTEALS